MEKTSDKYEVIKATTRDIDVSLGQRNYQFGSNGMFRLKDKGIASELKDKYHGDVTVTKVDYPHPADRGHKYTFSVPELPWHKNKEKVMPYKASGKWVMIKKKGRWVKHKRHENNEKARKHAAALNINVDKKYEGD